MNGHLTSRSFRLRAAVMAVLVVMISLLVGVKPAQAAETADWLPFMGSYSPTVGCTWNNGCDGGYHNGTLGPAIDFSVGTGTPVYAAGSGTVVASDNTCTVGATSCSGGRGRFVEISHADGRHSRYLHLSSVVKASGAVTRGDLIGYSGNTGDSTGPHLHYDETINGTKVDPGPMAAMHGTSQVSYPTALNASYTSWNLVPSFTKTVHSDGFGGGTSPSKPSLTGDNKADVAWYEAWNKGGNFKVLGTNSSGNGIGSNVDWFWGFSKPDWSALGDFNGDGKTDIVWYEAWNNGGTARILFSNGSGISSNVVWFSGYSKPDWATVADFNGDNKADIGWYEAWNNGGTLKVLLTNSAGTGIGANIDWFSGYSKPDFAGTGDFDGDNKADVAWYEAWNNGTLKVLYSSGSGVRGTTDWFSGYSKADWAAVGDLTGDNKADIAWYEAWNKGGNFKVLGTNSSGTGVGTNADWFWGYSMPDWSALGDFNGDGKSDVIWSEAWNNGTARVLFSNGSGISSNVTWFSGYSKAGLAFVG